MTGCIPQGDIGFVLGAGLPPHGEKWKKDPHEHNSTASAGLIHKELEVICMGPVGQVCDDGRDMGETRGPAAKMCGVLYMQLRESCRMWPSVPLCPVTVPSSVPLLFPYFSMVFSVYGTVGQRKWVNFSKMGYPWESYRKTLSLCPTVPQDLFFPRTRYGGAGVCRMLDIVV